MPATLTLVSDMGAEFATADASGRFEFRPMPPGKYELTAQASTPGRQARLMAGYQPIELDRDLTEIRVPIRPPSNLQFVFEDAQGNAVDSAGLHVRIRRRDLSGEGKPENLPISSDRAQLLPGRWDLQLVAASRYYVAGFSAAPSTGYIARGRPDGWNEVTVVGSDTYTVKFVLSPNAGMVRGTVTGSDNQAAAGAPVFLEAYDPDTGARPIELLTAYTTMRGEYQFTGLAPGVYRVLSTFEYQTPETAEMTACGAKTVKVEEGRTAQQDLDLYVVR
jgi:hypothetical protein